MIDIFNQMKLLLQLYHIIVFSSFVDDPLMKHYVGYSCCAVLVFGVAVNMIMMFYLPIKLLKFKCRRRFALKNAQ